MRIEYTTLIKNDYFGVNALSKSFLSAFYKSPAHAQMKKETSSMTFGTLFHEYILEPEKFKEKYIFTALNLATKEGRKFKEDNKDKIIFKEQELTALENMKRNFLKTNYDNVSMGEILENSIIEQGIIAQCSLEERKFKMKIKPDFIYQKSVIFDIKTINNIKNLYYDCRDFFYDWQSEIYRFIVSFHYGFPTDFIFLFVETKFPYGIMKITIDSHAIPEIENTIRKYHNWIVAGRPAEIYTEKIKKIKIRRNYED